MISLRFSGSLPKRGHAAESNEDRIASRLLPDGGLRVALADGASSTLFSGRWAELLVAAFVAQKEPSAGLPQLGPLRRDWYEAMTATPLPWHQQMQVSRGAAAAFLGVMVDQAGKWSAVAVGDCALFQIRGDECLLAFPATTEQDMASLPLLLQTHPSFASAEEGQPASVEGVLEPGDSLFLMTDALGSWFLHERERKREPWRWLQDIAHPGLFRNRIYGLNTASRLKIDDVTFAHITRIEEESPL